MACGCDSTALGILNRTTEPTPADVHSTEQLAFSEEAAAMARHEARIAPPEPLAHPCMNQPPHSNLQTEDSDDSHSLADEDTDNRSSGMWYTA